jgi:hypothetical protein
LKKAIVITTINPPRDEIYAYSKISDWQLICIGDKKSPKKWEVDKVIYLNPIDQQKEFKNFSKIIPWNIYGRKNIGYLHAIKNGAKIIAETDDDVFPYDNYPPTITKRKKIKELSGTKFINIYKYFTKSDCWPRGFPLELITNKAVIKENIKQVYAPIQNSVIDKDSDFDAVYRLVSNKQISFKKKGEYALAKGTFCPFNSQNTFFYPEVFQLLYIPFYVNPRVEDILRGYVAQRMLWEINANLVFTYTTAFTSNRNVHNFIKDFKSELPLYLDTIRLVQLLESLSLSSDISTSLIKVYEALTKNGFVKKNETNLVKAWIKETEKYL